MKLTQKLKKTQRVKVSFKRMIKNFFTYSHRLCLRRSLRNTNLWLLVSVVNNCLHNSYESHPALGSWLKLWSLHAFRRRIRRAAHQMVTHPSTNLYLCCLTSNSLHSIILPESEAMLSIVDDTDLEIKIEDGGLWIEDRPSRFEDSIMPQHHLIHIFLLILCHNSHYFEDIVKLWIFRLRTIHNFFQVCGPMVTF